jgi:hypothetical protein
LISYADTITAEMTNIMDEFDFVVVENFKDMEFTDEQLALLRHPSGLTNVLLCSNYWKQKYRLLDFTGTTVEDAIKKILTFYRHKTFRRLIGDHIFFEGFTIDDDNGLAIINLGS